MTYILKSPPSKELVDRILEETRELRKEADMGKRFTDEMVKGEVGLEYRIKGIATPRNICIDPITDSYLLYGGVIMESAEESINHRYLLKFNKKIYLFCETKNELFFYQETPAPNDPTERSALENAINEAILILRAEDIKTGWANARKNTINDRLV